jgi:hypothetical protein
MLRESNGRSGSIRCFVTDDSPRFESVASRFMGERLDPPTRVAPELLYDLEREYAAVCPPGRPLVATSGEAIEDWQQTTGADDADLPDTPDIGDDDADGLPVTADDSGEAGEYAGAALAASQSL